MLVYIVLLYYYTRCKKTYNKIYIMCCCFLNVSLIFPLLQITAQVVTSLEFISTNALQVWGGSSGHHDTVCNAACNIAHSTICTLLFRGKTHSDWFNGVETLQGRRQHGEKVGYCYPSGLEKILCKWDIYVPLVTKGLYKYMLQCQYRRISEWDLFCLKKNLPLQLNNILLGSFILVDITRLTFL